jgi:hypothetical protein
VDASQPTTLSLRRFSEQTGSAQTSGAQGVNPTGAATSQTKVAGSKGTEARGTEAQGSGSQTAGSQGTGTKAATGSSGTELQSPEVKAEIARLTRVDQQVRAHEQAHRSAGGSYAGAPTYQYQKGPDGKNYAVGGEVSIDAGTIRNDPQATIAKMEVVQRAALAPDQPSAQDLKVAAQAQLEAAKARQELSKQQAGGATGEKGQDQTATEDRTGLAGAVAGERPQALPSLFAAARGIAAYASAAGYGRAGASAGLVV